MKNGYKTLMLLTNTLNDNDSLIKEILSKNKESFSKNEIHINIAIGILGEIKDITANLDEEIFMFSKKLYNILTPIISYSKQLFNKYHIVNTYKLYDCLKIDLHNLKIFLNSIKGD